jgi:hypothetical protein
MIIKPAILYSSPLSFKLIKEALIPKRNREGNVPSPKKPVRSIPEKRSPVPAAAMKTVYDSPQGRNPKRAPRGKYLQRDFS